MRLLVITNQTAEGDLLQDTIHRIASEPGDEVVVLTHLGEADPLPAIADALASAPADELLIATRPGRTSPWLERDLISRACVRFGVPVAHVVARAGRAQASELVAAV